MPRSFSAFAIPTVALMPSARIASNVRDQVGGSSRRLPPTELGNFEVFRVTAELHLTRLGGASGALATIGRDQYRIHDRDLGRAASIRRRNG